MLHTIQHHLLDHTYTAWELAGYTLYVTKHTVVMWIVSGLMLLLVIGVGRWYRGNPVAPKGLLMNSLESFVLYVRDELVYPIMGREVGRDYLSFTLTLFLFILGCNFLGLVPTIKFGGWVIYPSATATGNVWISGGLAVFVLAMGVIFGIQEHGFIGYLAGFVPEGIPWWLIPLMWPIEVVGTLIRHAILAVRLLANMMAGHAILFGILGTAALFVGMLPSLAAGYAAALAPVLLGLLIYALEFLVALIQAYVFTLLSVIYLDMQVSGH